MSDQIPIWQEGHFPSNNPIESGLLSILVVKPPIRQIGTAFIVNASGDNGSAITAAHCFEGIRQILNPNASHHSTALPEFLPPPNQLDLEYVKAAYQKDGDFYLCDIELAGWDSDSDLAVFSFSARAEKPAKFENNFVIERYTPLVGEKVVMIGWGEMTSNPQQPGNEGPASGESFVLHRRLIARMGFVENVFPERHFLLKAPCIQTTIAICSGMSGGLVARFGPQSGDNSPIVPFALISHAPEPQPFYDSTQSGHSVAALLQPDISIGKAKERLLEFRLEKPMLGKSERSRGR